MSGHVAEGGEFGVDFIVIKIVRWVVSDREREDTREK